MELYLFVVILLIVLAIADLVVGVSNDAVNFLNSSIGSKVAPRYIIMIVASLGMLAGVTFSSGMMEVARKGIFHPKFFMMTEIMVIFLAVMLTDILLLDLYNTFGLPTSTTVSIVFELLGAAVAVSLIKINQDGKSFVELGQYINSGKALAIISGILLSVVIAFICGAIIQFVSRLIFTFDYHKRLKRYGAIWGGFALAMIFYFILIKGSKGASFITPDILKWIKGNTLLILTITFAISFAFLQMLLIFTKVNILKPVVLVGTFALAMAFAANDLVNFIGVPLAGLTSYQFASNSEAPLTMTMEALQNPIQTNTLYLLIAGIIMVITLWFSNKAKTVTKTEVNLSRQDEGIERFGSSALSRSIVRMVSGAFDSIKIIVPAFVRNKISERFNVDVYQPDQMGKESPPSFDLLRASVNLMVASALVSWATSMKLPLSTTYVTFMVAMGTSLSDKAWGRDSATYRVAGVLTVIGGWFFTAFMAFTVSSIFAVAIYYFQGIAIGIILLVALFIIYRNHRLHSKRESEESQIEVFNLKKVKDAHYAVDISFEHTGIFIKEIKRLVVNCFEHLFKENRVQLRDLKSEIKKIQNWANIIIANIYKTLRILHNQEHIDNTQKYGQTINSLQEIVERTRDSILRSYTHISNNHKGLLDEQIKDLQKIKFFLCELLEDLSTALVEKHKVNVEFTEKKVEKLKKMVKDFDRKQIVRIQNETSKTRLSILYYGLMNNSVKIAEHILKILKIFDQSMKLRKKKG